MYKIKVFCPICGFQTELEFNNKDEYYNSTTEQCTLCGLCDYELILKEVFFNNNTGHHETK